MDMKTYLSLPDDGEWLVEDVLPPGGSMLIYGDAKAGKSFAAMQLCLAITGDAPPEWLSLKVPEKARGPVVYFQLDTPRFVWLKRLKRDMKLTGREGVFMEDRDSLDIHLFNVLDPDHALRLHSALQVTKPVAVVIDTIREAHGQNENDSGEMRIVVSALTAAVAPAALILISHSRKPQAHMQGNITTESRGSNYLTGKMDALVHLAKRKNNKGKMKYSGRAIADGEVDLRRLHKGIWVVDEMQAELRKVLENEDLQTEAEQARALSARLGITVEAARGQIKRAKKPTD